jgi:uncharacterized protein
MPIPYDDWPRTDSEVAPFVRSLGLEGSIDIHVHALPPKLQEAVWAYFDRLDDPPWPITYRDDEATRFATLRDLGVIAHTTLAYGHRRGVAEWCNEHTLALADERPQVIPTFTFHAEPEAAAYVERAIARGGRIAKVHLQVGRFEVTDPTLDEVWPQLSASGIPVVIHASAVYGVDGGHEYCGPDVVRALLERHPDVTVVVAHLGAPDCEGFLTLAEQVPDLWLDTTMVLTDPPYFPPYPAELLARLAAIHDRVLFGSDFPSIPHPYVAQVRGLALLELDLAGVRAVLHDNAVRLLDDR